MAAWLVGYIAVFTKMSSAQQDVGNHYVVPEVFWFKGASSSMALPRRPIPAEFRRGNDLRTSKERGRNWKNVRRTKLFCPACELLGVHKEGRRHAWAKGYCTFCAKSKGLIEPEHSINRKRVKKDAQGDRVGKNFQKKTVVKVRKKPYQRVPKIIANSKASKPKAKAKARGSKPEVKWPKPAVSQERVEPIPFQGSWSDAIRSTGHHLRTKKWPASVVFVAKLPPITEPSMDRPWRRTRSRDIDVPDERVQFAMGLAELSMEEIMMS